MHGDKGNEPMSRVESREKLSRGRQFDFVVEKVRHPHGVRTEMGIVRHPGSTVIVPLFEDQSIGLIRQYRHAVSAYIYETPAGTMEPGEDPLVCARRELEEETGYAAGDMVPLGKTYLLPAYSDELTYVYLARNLTETSQDLDQDEIIDVHRLPFDQVLAMIETGEIVDALSILSIYHTVRHLGIHAPTARRYR